MIELEKVPLPIQAMVPEIAGCRVLVLQEGDDLVLDFPVAGRFGLLSHLDDPWQEPFSWVRVATVRGMRMFVARLARSYRPGDYALVVPMDAEWLDERLRLVLGVEAEDAG
jgi:hypothetical protein